MKSEEYEFCSVTSLNELVFLCVSFCFFPHHLRQISGESICLKIILCLTFILCVCVGWCYVRWIRGLLVSYTPRPPSKRKGGPFFLLEGGLGARLTACLLPVVYLLEGTETSCLIVVSVPDPQRKSLSVVLYWK